MFLVLAILGIIKFLISPLATVMVCLPPILSKLKDELTTNIRKTKFQEEMLM